VSPDPVLAASSVVYSNLMYLGGAVVLMIVLTLVIVLRQRKPKSVEANMESFNRGLRALAPTPQAPRRSMPPDTGRVEPRRRSVQTVSDPDHGPSPEA
jgi:hypothetical protein